MNIFIFNNESDQKMWDWICSSIHWLLVFLNQTVHPAPDGSAGSLPVHSHKASCLLTSFETKRSCNTIGFSLCGQRSGKCLPAGSQGNKGSLCFLLFTVQKHLFYIFCRVFQLIMMVDKSEPSYSILTQGGERVACHLFCALSCATSRLCVHTLSFLNIFLCSDFNRNNEIIM